MKSVLASIPLVLMLVLAPSAQACACCAEPGTWFERSGPMAGFEYAELQRVRFSPVAKLYLTAGGIDTIKGIQNASGRYTLTQSRVGRRWQLMFRDARGNSGMVVFSIPRSAVTHGVDLRDGRQSGGGGPLLHKEYRLAGVVSGTGIFARGMAGQPRFRLILQGRGNVCLAAGDFKHWRLEVTGPRADYAFYGSLKPPARG